MPATPLLRRDQANFHREPCRAPHAFHQRQTAGMGRDHRLDGLSSGNTKGRLRLQPPLRVFGLHSPQWLSHAAACARRRFAELLLQRLLQILNALLILLLDLLEYLLHLLVALGILQIRPDCVRASHPFPVQAVFVSAIAPSARSFCRRWNTREPLNETVPPMIVMMPATMNGAGRA